MGARLCGSILRWTAHGRGKRDAKPILPRIAQGMRIRDSILPHEQSRLRFEVSHPFRKIRGMDGARSYFGLFISGHNTPQRVGLLLSAQNTLLKNFNDMGFLQRCFFC